VLRHRLRTSACDCEPLFEPPDAAVLVVWYTLLATALVWCPVVAYLLAGEWAVVQLDAGLAWMARHSRPLLACAVALFGVLLLVDGLVLV